MMIKIDAIEIKARCVLCGGCVAVCLNNAIILTGDTLEIDEERCTGCKTCVIFCPMDAVRYYNIEGDKSEI